MSKNAVLVTIVLAFVFLQIIFIVFNEYRSRGTKARIEEIAARKYTILNADSLRTVIERKIVDSMQGEFKKRDIEIQKLKTDLTKTRKQNEELEKFVNSIRVDMPNY